MGKQKMPVTPAIRVLRGAKIDFSEHLYTYEDNGGTALSARELQVDEHSVIKTLIMENDQGKPLVVLMHGDCEVSTKNLARTLGAKSVSPCAPDKANKLSGYLVGGTSPFGTRTRMPVYVEETILDLPRVYINGGKRGFLVGLNPQDIVKILESTTVQVGIKKT